MARYKYQPTYRGMDGWFVSGEAHTLCVKAATEAAVYAKSIAPVGRPPDDEDPGRYRDSITVDPTPRIIPARATKRGRFAARTSAAVVAEAEYAAAVEVQYGYHTLLRTTEHIGSPKPRRRV